MQPHRAKSFVVTRKCFLAFARAPRASFGRLASEPSCEASPRPNRCQRTAITRYFREVARIIHAVRRAAKRIAITAAATAGGAALERLLLAAPRYRGPQSDHFDGRRFHNVDRGRQSDRAFLKWQLTRQPWRWRDIDAPPGLPPPARVEKGDLRVTFINHSTTLLQFDGVNILTDPVWSERVSPFSFAGPRRHRPPGIRFDDLPPLREHLHAGRGSSGAFDQRCHHAPEHHQHRGAPVDDLQ